MEHRKAKGHLLVNALQSKFFIIDTIRSVAGPNSIPLSTGNLLSFFRSDLGPTIVKPLERVVTAQYEYERVNAEREFTENLKPFYQNFVNRKMQTALQEGVSGDARFFQEAAYHWGLVAALLRESLRLSVSQARNPCFQYEKHPTNSGIIYNDAYRAMYSEFVSRLVGELEADEGASIDLTSKKIMDDIIFRMNAPCTQCPR